MSSNKSKVSIIAINYNSTAYTMDFIASIDKYHGKEVEIIIVDNASEVSPKEEILTKFPDVVVLECETNLGFAGGNNLGYRHASGDFIFFANNDTLFTAGLLDGLMQVFQDYPGVGLVCPKIKFFEPYGLIQYAGSTPLNPWTARNSTYGAKEKDLGQYDKTYETAFPHGAAMMVPRAVIEKAGMMPEDYFLYYEELDWGAMLKRAGYKLIYNGKVEIIHRESSSIGKSNPFKTYYMNRNRILFVKRNFPKIHQLFFSLYFGLLAFPKGLLVFALKGEWEHCKALWSAVRWHFKSPLSRAVKYESV
ncbi:glycosyltransferase family 2 protein [Persicobacter diffluens]|uniref:Glycosyl transferase n=1 Tax=Persicobacter diffluens TaxID=981 RepID=A0AAN4VYU2_9BACT|nr:glycosyl transferase [Persicobacter diffluens]